MSCGLQFPFNYTITGDCSNSNVGAISFEITGSTAPPYDVYEVSGSGLLPFSGSVTSYFADSLSAGTYTLAIVDNCLSPGPNTTYLPFTISSGSCVSLTDVINTSCGLNNGVLNGVFTPYYGSEIAELYETSTGYISSANTSVIGEFVFNGLSAGTYYVVGYDGGGCTGKTQSCIIKSSTTLNFGVYVIDDASCITTEGQGKIIVTGQTGTPPYTYSWSSNANGQTGSTVTGLTDGLYTVTVTDYSGCSSTKSVIVPCTPLVSGYIYLPVISTGFTVTTDSERDFSSMVYEGFYDLTSGNTNCVLSSATYTAFVEVSGNTYEDTFFTGTTLSGVPTEAQWIESLETILSGVTGVSTYTFDTVNNKVTVKSSCDGTEDDLADSEFIIGLTIDYDIYCESWWAQD